MTTSESIGNVAAALVAAQAQFAPVLKNAKNPHLRNKYADLEAVLRAVQPALDQNGLAVLQGVDPQASAATGAQMMGTTIIHTSGEYLRTYVGIEWETSGKGTNIAQRYGGGLTYARRYGLLAALGLAPEDDDGCSAGGFSRAQGGPPSQRPQGNQGPPPAGRLEPENRGGKPWASSADFRRWLEDAQGIPGQAYFAWREAQPDKGELDLGNEWHVGGAWVKLIQGELQQLRTWVDQQLAGGKL